MVREKSLLFIVVLKNLYNYLKATKTATVYKTYVTDADIQLFMYTKTYVVDVDIQLFRYTKTYITDADIVIYY